MANNGATQNYKFGQKNNWRARQYNRIDRRLKLAGIKRTDAVVLYLGGGADLDRPILLRHGFRGQNLIAVERDPRAHRQLRTDGKLVVLGELTEVLMAWPPKRRIDVVICDFCAGLNDQCIKLMEATAATAVADAIIAVNLLRGRDPESAAARRLILQATGLFAVQDQKHRGRLFFDLLSACVARWLGADTEAKARCVVNFWQHHGAPEFDSYRSISGQTFDSVMFWNPVGAQRRLDVPTSQCVIDGRIVERRPLVRRIAAVLAHQTRRQGAA